MVDKKGAKAGELPKVNEVETVSPATRLLNKRRQMYENQEQYKLKKKEFQQAEIQFRVKEKELRDKDQEIQESLITFANYLDANQKAMKKSDENRAKLQTENEAKDQEIQRKDNQLRILKEKAKRIEKQKQAVEKYHAFLENVRAKNSDEYGENTDSILSRYTTLTNAHVKLS